MRSHLPLAALVLSFCLLTACNDSTKPVAVVDTARIFSQSMPSQEAEKHLQKVQQTLQKGLTDLAALYKGKENTPEGQKTLTEGYNALQKQMATERQALSDLLQQTLHTTIKAWRATNGYSVVIAKQNLLDSDNAVDVTEAILVEMNKQKLTFPPLPTVTIRPSGKDGPEAAGASPRK